MKTVFLSAALSLVCCKTAYAFETVVGRVTYLEATYLPSLVQFTADSGSPSCPVGTYLKWQKADQSNNKAVYATLMFAIASGKKVRLYVNDGDNSCIGQYIHLLPD